MLESIIIGLSNFVINIIDSSGLLGIVLLMGIESAAIPLPSEVIMPFSGFLVAEGRFTLIGIAFAGALGSVWGSWITYALGRYGGRPLARKYGRYVLITEHDLDLADRFFARFGVWATFLGRMLPIVRTYISIPAGVSKVKFWPFTLAAFSGSFIWSFFLGWVGLRLGERWDEIRTYFERLDFVIAIIIIAGIVWWILRHVRNRLR